MSVRVNVPAVTSTLPALPLPEVNEPIPASTEVWAPLLIVTGPTVVTDTFPAFPVPLHNGANVLAGSCAATAAATCNGGGAAGTGGGITVSVGGSATVDSGPSLGTVASAAAAQN